MKIFPPIREMLWPPGRSTAQMLWGHRFVLLAITGLVAFAVVWPALHAPAPPGTPPKDAARPTPIQADAARPADTAAPRLEPPALHGTLTAADRAIVAPSAGRQPVRVPPLAQTPKPTAK